MRVILCVPVRFIEGVGMEDEGAPGPSLLGTGELRQPFHRRRVHNWSILVVHERSERLATA